MRTPLLKPNEHTWRFWFDFPDRERATLAITVARGFLPKYTLSGTAGVTPEIAKPHAAALNKFKRGGFMAVARALRLSRADRIRFFNELEDGFAALHPQTTPGKSRQKQ